MKPETIKVAADEARRFLSRVDAAEKAFRQHPVSNTVVSKGFFWCNDDTYATAALKRSSMDLTRALAVLRRNG